MSDKKTSIENAVERLTANYRKEELFLTKSGRHLPVRAAIINIVKEMRSVIFPGYFDIDSGAAVFPEHYVGDDMTSACGKAAQITSRFFEQLPEVQEMLLKDVQAGFDGDPAAKSKEEIIFSYPGFLAIYVYRLAHILYLEEVPFIPRIMTEYAHDHTGIDINPGATIGEYFFIDHGTGVVIGETTEIGNNVKLYQGVTLGALSTRSGQKLKGKKRHPTIKDNVTVYSGASILGGETEIGEGVIVAGGAFVTKSVPAHTKVIVKNPEIKIKDSDKKIELQTTENKEGIWEI